MIYSQTSHSHVVLTVDSTYIMTQTLCHTNILPFIELNLTAKEHCPSAVLFCCSAIFFDIRVLGNRYPRFFALLTLSIFRFVSNRSSSLLSVLTFPISAYRPLIFERTSPARTYLHIG